MERNSPLGMGHTEYPLSILLDQKEQMGLKWIDPD